MKDANNFVQLGNENFLSELLSSNGDEKFKDRLMAANPQSVLDVGFRFGVDLYFMYHDFGFTRLKGIDAEPATTILGNSYSSYFDLYTSEFGVPETITPPKINSKEKFEKQFDFTTDQYLCEYIKATKDDPELFDFIICGNSLHFRRRDIKDINSVFSHVNSRLAENGLFYIRVKEFPSEKKQGRKCNFRSWKDAANEQFKDRQVVVFNNKNEKEGLAYTITNITY